MATKADKTRRKPSATAIVAGALGITDVALRGRLHYHDIKSRGRTVKQLVTALQKKTKVQLTPAQRRTLGLNGNGTAPPVLENPHGPNAAADTATAIRAKNLHLALIALTGVEDEILPLRPGHYGKRELRELEALRLLRAIDKS